MYFILIYQYYLKYFKKTPSSKNINHVEIEIRQSRHIFCVNLYFALEALTLPPSYIFFVFMLILGQICPVGLEKRFSQDPAGLKPPAAARIRRKKSIIKWEGGFVLQQYVQILTSLAITKYGRNFGPITFPCRTDGFQVMSLTRVIQIYISIFLAALFWL